MCNCNKQDTNRSHLKIYTVMADYKAKKDVILVRNGERFILRESSEEELSYLYEDLGLISLVEKVSINKQEDEQTTKETKSGNNKKKKSSKKPKDTKD